MSSPVGFKIDEDLPAEVAELVRASGHDAVTVFQQGMHGWSDDQLWTAVSGERRSLITADIGFADARRLSGTNGVGIVLLRVARESRLAYIQLARNFLASYPIDQIPGRIVSVTTDGIRAHDTLR